MTSYIGAEGNLGSQRIDELLAWNRRYVAEAAHPGLPPFPGKRVAVVTCMDTRILPDKLLGVKAGDVHIIRNAGGIVTDDVIRSLMLSQVALGTDEVMVIGHTKCGLEGMDDRDLRTQVERSRGRRPLFQIGGFPAVEDSIRESLRALRRSPYLDGDVRGFVFDVDTGELREITR